MPCQAHGVEALYNSIQAQAAVMTYSDLYWVFGVALMTMMPLVLLLKPVDPDAEVSLTG